MHKEKYDKNQMAILIAYEIATYDIIKTNFYFTVSYLMKHGEFHDVEIDFGTEGKIKVEDLKVTVYKHLNNSNQIRTEINVADPKWLDLVYEALSCNRICLLQQLKWKTNFSLLRRLINKLKFWR